MNKKWYKQQSSKTHMKLLQRHEGLITHQYLI